MFGSSNTFASRRVVSLPEKMPLGLRIPIQTEYDDYEDEKRSSLLPLSTPSSPGRTARRLTMGLRLRAERYYIPLILISLCLTGLYFFAGPSVRSHGLQGRSRFHLKQHDALHLPSRNMASNGVSLLSQDEDELIAEDDLYWDKQPDHQPLTEDQKAAEAELHAHQLDVLAQNRMGSLRALIWWIAEGGVFPADWEIPSKAYLKKVGARGMERLLEDIDAGTDEEAIFEDGWADFAKRRYRIVVFSKSYCPYSRKAKGILETYHLTPAPFVIELDQRPDTHTIQTLLDHLTGRRTVPNLIFDFVPIGGADDTMLLHSEGGLQRQFIEMGVVPGSPRRPPKLDQTLPEDIPPPGGANEVAAPAAPAAKAQAKGAPAAGKKVNAPVAQEVAAKPVAQPAKNPGGKPALPAGKKVLEKPIVVAPKKAMEKAAKPIAHAQEAFQAPARQHAAPLVVQADDDEVVDPELESSLDEEDVPEITPTLEDDSVDLEDDSDEDDEPELAPPSAFSDDEEEDELETPIPSENGDEDEDEYKDEDEDDAPINPTFDYDLDDDEEVTKIPHGASPDQIRAAIQAAHGDDYLYQSDDEDPSADEDAAYVGDMEMLRAGRPLDDSPPAPVRAKAGGPVRQKVEAAAKKVLKAGADKVGAAIKEKAANVKDRVDAARRPNVAAGPFGQKAKAAPQKIKPKGKPIVVPPKKIEAVAPPPKKAPAAAAHKKVEPVAPPRNKVEAVAQKKAKAQAVEAIADKKAEVAAVPKKKAAAPVANANAAKAPLKKGMDKVDAREVLKPAAKKDAALAKDAAPIKKAAAAAPVAPVKKDPKARVAGGGKKAIKLAPPVKKDEEAEARRRAAPAGAKRLREPLVETPVNAKAGVKKAEEPAAKVKARNGGAVVGAGNGVAKKDITKPKAAKRKGKVL